MASAGSRCGDLPTWRSGQQARGEHPDDAPDDDDGADQGRQPDDLDRWSVPETFEDRRQLQPDQDEEETIEDEPDHLPGRQPQEPAARRQDRPEPTADDEAGCDRREHPRQAESIRREVGRERDDHGDQDLDRWVVEAAQDLARDATDDGADDDPAGSRDHEPDQGFREDEGATDRRDHCRAVGDERGRIVEQGLALDERPDDPRRPEPAEDG